MNMRMPAIPLITVDPYFSVFSFDNLNDRFPKHWTDSRMAILGTVTIDGEEYRFMGDGTQKKLCQCSVDIDAFSTEYVFESADIVLTARFTTPILVTDCYYASRPVSYLHLSYRSISGAAHRVTARVCCSEELVLNLAGEGRALARKENIDGVSAISLAKANQKVLSRCGDDVRIDWGRLFLGVRGKGECGDCVFEDLYAVYAETALENDALFLFGYDDIKSIEYFGEPLDASWKKGGMTIEKAIAQAAGEYELLLEKCGEFSRTLKERAIRAGGEEYAELLLLAYRQVMAAHKAVTDRDGQLLYISKECFSNGCAATVDVTYPSAPMFLLYNPEFLKGMLRPIFTFARSDAWNRDFAPHDVGTYPLLNGQVYGGGQMPVEECGNMLILTAAIGRVDRDFSFAKENLPLLRQWSRYLEIYGLDPENQLCTDDFAGHLAHNVNLAIKAVMGLVGYADILSAFDEKDEAARVVAVSKDYAAQIEARSKSDKGGSRLTYDAEGTFSLKYNAVWDRLWKTGLFSEEFYRGEICRYRQEAFPYGVPLDSRRTFTKSDWEMWCACLSGRKEDFEFFAHRLFCAYHTMSARVPMTDWYYANTSELAGWYVKGNSKMRGFRSRSVQGGLFFKLLFD